MEKAIIWGCGNIGKDLLGRIDPGELLCFCDSSEDKCTKIINGISVISSSELLERYRDNLIVIAMSEVYTDEVISVLKKADINTYILCDMFVELYNSGLKVRDIYRLYKENQNREKIWIDLYKQQLRNKQRQIDFLKDTCDLANQRLKRGYIKKCQEKTILLAKQIIEEIKNYSIKPVLIEDSLDGFLYNQSMLMTSKTMTFGLDGEGFNSFIKFAKNKYNYYFCGDNQALWEEITASKDDRNVAVEYNDRIEILRRDSLLDLCFVSFKRIKMDKDLFYPLIKSEFEGVDVLLPNRFKELSNIDLNKYHEKLIELEYQNTGNKDEWIKNNLITVEFYLIDSFEIEHFVPLYYYFRNNGIYARFVLEHPDINTARKWFNYEAAKEKILDLGLEYSEELNEKANVAFTTQKAEILSKYRKETIRINLQYGCSLLKQAFGVSKASVEGFDFKFVNGEFDKELCQSLLLKTKVINIGYPKYMNRRKDLVKDNIKKELGINTEKPILLYLPTWDEYNSIQKYKESILEIKDDYYIITKPHHCTYRLEDRLRDKEIIFEISDKVVEPSYDLYQLMNMCDITLIDAKSGVALESVFLNPNVKTVWLMPNMNNKGLFREDIDKIARIVYTPNELHTVLEVEKNDTFYVNYRKKNIEKYFSECSIEMMDRLSDMIKAEVKNR